MTETSHHIADAGRDNWVERLLPLATQPYAQLMRLDRPIGWWLLLLPCWWGLFLAQVSQGGGLPSLWFAFLFWVGAIVMRGAGCTLNDIVDRDFDGRVARTKGRPIPSGRVSVKQAFIFLATQSLLGLAVLLQFNFHTVVLATASLLIVAIYPFMKRITNWPQLVLGLAFNWGALVGWLAVAGEPSGPMILLYAGSTAWVIGYDTIYALQDREDDALIGVRSSALRLGGNVKPGIGLFYGIALACWAGAFWIVRPQFLTLATLLPPAFHLGWQVVALKTDDGGDALAKFRSNRFAGFLVALACLVVGASA